MLHFMTLDGAGQTSKLCCFNVVIILVVLKLTWLKQRCPSLCATDSRDISTPRHRSVGSEEEGRFVIDPRTLSRGPLSAAE